MNARVVWVPEKFIGTSRFSHGRTGNKLAGKKLIASLTAGAPASVYEPGAGAMTVSHANDSYFWVVTGFGGIKARDGYRTMTLMTLLMGLTAIAVIALAAALLL